MRIISILVLLMASVVTYAQFKVVSDGKVYIQKTNEVGNSIVNVGNIPNSDFDTYYVTDTRIGLHVQEYDSQQKSYGIGILGETKKSPRSGYSIGVWGDATGGTGNQNIGVLGTIHPDMTGAGVYGTTEGGPAPAVAGAYAGYFYGDTYVDGSLIAYDICNLSDMRLRDNVIPLDSLDIRGGYDATLEKMLGIGVLSYNLKHASDKLLQDKKSESRTSKLKETDAKRRHFGVSAQELQTLFPDLVREGQDGFLTVNYIEMIPLLLHCIQEQQRQINELKADNEAFASRQSFSQDNEVTEVTEVTHNQSALSASLRQNTPNPFTERTTIRFSLPDDAHDAYIYIFDMTGKMQKQIPVTPSMQCITINGYELQAGMYIYSLVVGGKEMDTKRMILSK